MNYETLKDKIKNILSDIPADLYDEDSGTLFQGDTWELVQDRDPSIFEDEIDWDEEEIVDAKAVGSANLIVANTVLLKALKDNNGLLSELKRVSSNNQIYGTKESAEELFQLVMQDLEDERIIRKKPEVVREGFKIVGCTECLNQ